MSTVLSATPQTGQHAGLPVLACDDSGNLSIVGALILSEQAAAPIAQAGVTAVYADASGKISFVGPNGAAATVNIGGILTAGALIVDGGAITGTNGGIDNAFALTVRLYNGQGGPLQIVQAQASTIDSYVNGVLLTSVSSTGEAVAKNVTVGSTAALGDNGVGELQLANATSVATTNPSGGALVYAAGGGVFTRDPAGTVSSLIAGGQAGGEPTGVVASTCHAFTASASATPTSGTLYLQRVWLAAGQTLTKVGFVTGLTAASGPTHWWTAILDNTYKQVAHSADQLATAIPASTWQNLALTGTFTAPYSGAYFLAVMIATSTTQPTLVSTTTVPNAALISGTGALGPVPGGTSTTGLTAPGTDGVTTYATPTAAANFYYMFAS